MCPGQRPENSGYVALLRDVGGMFGWSGSEGKNPGSGLPSLDYRQVTTNAMASAAFKAVEGYGLQAVCKPHQYRGL
jgi:hypothetical protein